MRARVIGLAVLSLVAGACGGGGTPASNPPSPSASASTAIEADIDVDGRTMHLVCEGPTDTGEPTILLEAGGGGDYLSWAEILPEVRSTHRVCAYDRAGLGKSDPPAEASRTAADQVTDLRTMLDAAGIGGPFVIGAHSYGGSVAILFTQAYPDEVAALLFVDPESPHFSARARQALPPPSEDEPASITELREGFEQFEVDPSQNPEHLHIRNSLELAAAALDAPGPLFERRPVLVLTAGISGGTRLGLPAPLARTIDALWAASHQELAEESTAGSRETVPDAGHEIQVDRPQAVIDALEEILGALTAS